MAGRKVNLHDEMNEMFFELENYCLQLDNDVFNSTPEVACLNKELDDKLFNPKFKTKEEPLAQYKPNQTEPKSQEDYDFLPDFKSIDRSNKNDTQEETLSTALDFQGLNKNERSNNTEPLSPRYDNDNKQHCTNRRLLESEFTCCSNEEDHWTGFVPNPFSGSNENETIQQLLDSLDSVVIGKRKKMDAQVSEKQFLTSSQSKSMQDLLDSFELIASRHSSEGCLNSEEPKTKLQENSQNSSQQSSFEERVIIDTSENDYDSLDSVVSSSEKEDERREHINSQKTIRSHLYYNTSPGKSQCSRKDIHQNDESSSSESSTEPRDVMYYPQYCANNSNESTLKSLKSNNAKINHQDAPLTPLTKLKQYKIKRSQKLAEQKDDQTMVEWEDNSYIRAGKDEEDNWTTTPLFHPFWYECMYIVKRREQEKHEKLFMKNLRPWEHSENSRYSNSSIGLDNRGCSDVHQSRSLSYYYDNEDMISIFKFFW